MAIDTLQTKIRKMKNPSMLAFSYHSGWLPEGQSYESAAQVDALQRAQGINQSVKQGIE